MMNYWDQFLEDIRNGLIKNYKDQVVFSSDVSQRLLLELFFDYLKKYGAIK